MTQKITSIGIIKESRNDERRAPIAPEQIKEIKIKFPELNIYIQPCSKRSFENEEYVKNGGILNENLDHCELIFGVKEIDVNVLIQDILVLEDLLE